METLKLCWLGAPFIELKGRTVKLETRKATALLAYLSLNLGECQRERLATMFWPKESQQKALANLRCTLCSLSEISILTRLNRILCNFITGRTDHQESK